MENVKLLDCTLRDGGYVNDWKFGKKNMVSLFERLVDSGVDIIEIGFLDDRRPFDEERSIMPDTESAGRIYGALDRKQAEIVGMIDYGTCDIKNIQPRQDTCIDGIRVIFKKHLMHEAMDYCRQVKKLGYKVYSQLVSVANYTDEDMMELIGLVNDVEPYAVSMVDTYGLLYPDTMLHLYEMLDTYVEPGIGIGFHAHNNFQMAYANSLAFLEKERKHDIIIDGTLYGMGKSAGNAPIELIAKTLNEHYGKNYKIDPMLEAIEETVMPFYQKSPWGYKEFFYLCAKNNCHPNYVSFFEEKENLSTSKIDELLSLIEPEEKKLLYDKEVAEELYQDYVAGLNETENKKKLKELLSDRDVLLVGPGKNIELQKKTVGAFIDEKKPYVISVNYLPQEIHPGMIFVTNANRYHEMTLVEEEIKASGTIFMATSNVERRNGTFEISVNRAPLLEPEEKFKDNSFLMLLKLLKDIGIGKVYAAGFDGYSEDEDNYQDAAMEYRFVKSEAKYLNNHMKKAIAEIEKEMPIDFITFSRYRVEEDIHSAAI